MISFKRISLAIVLINALGSNVSRANNPIIVNKIVIPPRVAGRVVAPWSLDKLVIACWTAQVVTELIIRGVTEMSDLNARQNALESETSNINAESKKQALKIIEQQKKKAVHAIKMGFLVTALVKGLDLLS